MKEESELARLNRRLKSANACLLTAEQLAQGFKKFSSKSDEEISCKKGPVEK